MAKDHILELEKIASHYDFQILRHCMSLYGLCRHCSRPEHHEMSLSLARPNQRFRITGFNGGRKSRERLRSMGLSVGDEIEVVNIFGGQFVIAVARMRLVIGKGLAQKIMIRRL